MPSLAATTGVEGPEDVVKYLLAGADVVMTASRANPARTRACRRLLLDGLAEWMVRKGYTSVADLRGLLAVPAPTDQADYERASYVRALHAANVARSPW